MEIMELGGLGGGTGQVRWDFTQPCVLSFFHLAVQSRTYSSMTVEERSMLYVGDTHGAPKGWDCYNRPLIPRWIAVILASEFGLVGAKYLL